MTTTDSLTGFNWLLMRGNVPGRGTGPERSKNTTGGGPAFAAVAGEGTPMNRREDPAVTAVRDACQPLSETGDDLAPVLAAVGDARLVLVGEASHGTHEFYDYRARLTRRLVEERGFTAVIVEADWPDAYRVNRFVRGTGDDPDAAAALGGFRRFPQWMWRNADVLSFVAWLRDHNAGADHTCGFYGMDLYSLHASIEAVLGYLDKTDPAAARRARYRYGCFEQFGDDPQAYGYAAGFDLGKTCEDEVVAQLVDLQRQARTVWQHDGQPAEDEHFFAERNAALVRNAEAYYRQMFARDEDTWTLRDTHMVDTIDGLLAHLDRTRGGPTRAVVWAHNSHLGDARATEMADRGEANVGQLCRQRWGDRVFNVGFTTHTGTVAAADDWGGPVRSKRVNPSLPGSYERLFHDVGVERFAIVFRDAPAAVAALGEPRIERAIGVIYRPRTERGSHYFRCDLPRQFNAVVHLDTTSAVRPMEPFAAVEHGEAETYPSGV